jgi:pyroglutamyl-peptidase
MPPIFLVTGFEPFGGDRSNPSWLVARRFDGDEIGSLRIKSVKIPVSCAGAARRVSAAIVRYRPRAVLGLGQAGGRPHVSLERVAINLAQAGARGEHGVGGAMRPVVADGPEAYFARLPLEAIVRELKRKQIPAAISLTAGAYACNALMFTALYALRRRPVVPVGFIHLPYEPRQAARRRDAVASMSLDVMERAVRIAIGIIARAV